MLFQTFLQFPYSIESLAAGVFIYHAKETVKEELLRREKAAREFVLGGKMDPKARSKEFHNEWPKWEFAFYMPVTPRGRTVGYFSLESQGKRQKKSLRRVKMQNL